MEAGRVHRPQPGAQLMQKGVSNRLVAWLLGILCLAAGAVMAVEDVPSGHLQRASASPVTQREILTNQAVA